MPVPLTNDTAPLSVAGVSKATAPVRALFVLLSVIVLLPPSPAKVAAPLVAIPAAVLG